MDTLQIAGEPCADLAFTPFNSESFGFNGHLYVTLDSTYFVKRAVFNFSKKINLNFVDYMLLEQEFKRAEDGTRLLDHESITVEFKLTEGQDGIFARRVADYSNYTFTPTAEADKAFTKPERIIEETEALSRPETFWAENRPQAAHLPAGKLGRPPDDTITQLSGILLDGESTLHSLYGIYSYLQRSATFLYRPDECHYQR